MDKTIKTFLKVLIYGALLGTLNAHGSLGLEKACGSKRINYKPPGFSKSYTVFSKPDKVNWFKWNKCLKTLRDQIYPGMSSWRRNTLKAQVYYIFSSSSVRFFQQKHDRNPDYKTLAQVAKSWSLDLSTFDSVVNLNNARVAFDSMGAAGLGYQLLLLHKKLKDSSVSDEGGIYLHLGNSVLHLLTDQVKYNGLQTRQTCHYKRSRDCRWFHSTTSRDQQSTTQGAVLNKHLHAVRGLANSARVLDEIINEDHHTSLYSKSRLRTLRNRYRWQAVSGLDQLFFAANNKSWGEAPNFRSFIATDSSGRGAKESWIYYGYRGTNQEPYFLKMQVGKDYDFEIEVRNCNYHNHVIGLLIDIRKLLKEHRFPDYELAKKRTFLGTSYINYMLDAYRAKSVNFGEDDPDANHNKDFTSCADKSLLKKPQIDYLKSLK